MLLELQGVSVSFDGLKALENVDLTVKEGMIMSLIGPNGSGKTTLFNVISGLVCPTQGRVLFQDHDVTGKKPFQISRRGIARTFQNIRLFGHMSVTANVMVGGHNNTQAGVASAVFRSPAMRREERELQEKALSLLEFVGLAGCADEEAASLPYGRQRLLELARALAASPRLLLLDEPTAGMNLTETAMLTRMIGKIRDLGITVFLVEHRMKVVMGISDQVAILDHGVKIGEGTPEEIKNDEKVIRAYLGEKRHY
jgi:ABC-type branched-subunit amino acid transport system ATPase component